MKKLQYKTGGIISKQFLTLAAALMFAACVNDMEYKPASMADELILNSLIDASDSLHTVYVSVSRPGEVVEAKNAGVNCFLNGVPVKTVEIEPDDEGYASFYQQRVFQFVARLKADDEITLEATANGFKAVAKALVPVPAIIVSADTSTLVRRGEEDYGTERLMLFRIETKDVSPDRDFFFLEIGHYLYFRYLDGDGNVLGEGWDRNLCPLDVSDDLVLSEESIASSQGMDFFKTGSPDLYGAFQDAAFAGGSINLRPKISLDRLSYHFNIMPPPENAVEIELRHFIGPKVSHISQRHYYYLKALDMLRDGGTDLALEDVSIPDNVDGGIGFVGISNPDLKLFDLGQPGP